jgi:hypothetical protein
MALAVSQNERIISEKLIGKRGLLHPSATLHCTAFQTTTTCTFLAVKISNLT